MATCGAGAAIAGRAIPAPIPPRCAEAIAGRTAREAIAIRKRRMVSTWVPGPPGLSCTYIDKDAPFGAGVSREKPWLTITDPPPGFFVSADSKGVRGGFFVSAGSTGDRAWERREV